MPDGTMQQPGGWNRFSIEVPDLEATVVELRVQSSASPPVPRAGATRVRRVDPDGRMETGFVVMQDPEGNEFCLD